MTTSDTTTYTDTVDGTLSDLAVGDNVVVTGSTSGDQLAATAIVDRGTLETGGGFGGGGGAPNGTLPEGFTPPDGSVPAGFTPPGGTAPAGGAPAGGRGGPGGGFTAGQIASIDGSTVTVTTRDGSTVKVTTDASTTVQVTKQIALQRPRRW